MTKNQQREIIALVSDFEAQASAKLAALKGVTGAEVDKVIGIITGIVKVLPIPATIKSVVLLALPIIGDIVKVFTPDAV